VLSPAIRYDTISCFSVRSKADVGLSQLNRPHVTKKYNKWKKKKQLMLKSIVKQSAVSVESLLEKKKAMCGGKDLRYKVGFKAGVKE